MRPRARPDLAAGGYGAAASGRARAAASASSFRTAFRYSRFLLRSASGSGVAKFAPRTISPGSRSEKSPSRVSASGGQVAVASRSRGSAGRPGRTRPGPASRGAGTARGSRRGSRGRTRRRRRAAPRGGRPASPASGRSRRPSAGRAGSACSRATSLAIARLGWAAAKAGRKKTTRTSHAVATRVTRVAVARSAVGRRATARSAIAPPATSANRRTCGAGPGSHPSGMRGGRARARSERRRLEQEHEARPRAVGALPGHRRQVAADHEGEGGVERAAGSSRSSRSRGSGARGRARPRARGSGCARPRRRRASAAGARGRSAGRATRGDPRRGRPAGRTRRAGPTS